MSPSPSRDLVLLTTRYPFDDHEAVLDPEVAVLSERFRRVFVLPSHRGDQVRPLPPNVVLKELPWYGPWPRAAKLRALLSAGAYSALLPTLRRRSRWRPYLVSWRFYLDILAINLLKARELRRFVEAEKLERAVFYDYWFENSTLALALLRRSNVIATAVSRAHNFDIYDEDWESGAVPFAEFKGRCLDRIFAVSQHGARHIGEHLPVSTKTAVARLGVTAQDRPPLPRPDTPLVVSCAWLHPRKRIHLIPEILVRIGRPVRWIHFGDGVDRPRVAAAAAMLPDHVQWELRGRVDNRDVLDFYREHHVDALLSLSTSEGVPVSMMEAQSFGIPIVATAVRGVPEIVTEATGVLLDSDADVGRMAAGLCRALERDRFDRSEILAFFREHFEARRNYSDFADNLVALGDVA